MKSTFLKAILVLIVVFGTFCVYAQEEKEQQKAIEVEWDKKPIKEPRIDPEVALMRPRWIIPYIHLEIYGRYDLNWIFIGIANSSYEYVKGSVIFYDMTGEMKLHETFSLSRKESDQMRINMNFFSESEDSFQGHVEIEANSPFLYISAEYYRYKIAQGYEKELSFTIPKQVFRIEP